MLNGVTHLPYQLDDSRFCYYETHWKNCALELLQKHVDPRGKSLLDYGCGRGESLKIFADAGMRTTGADMDPECVRIAAQHGKTVQLQNDPLAQFGERSFDVVACFHVLEHVEAPKQVLCALSKIAREYVLIAVPNLRYLHRLFSRNFDYGIVNEGHLQSWDHWHFHNLAARHCNLELIGWGSDATILPVISNLSEKVLGKRATIALETGLFRRLFPYHCVSVLGLFRVKAQ